MTYPLITDNDRTERALINKFGRGWVEDLKFACEFQQPQDAQSSFSCYHIVFGKGALPPGTIGVDLVQCKRLNKQRAESLERLCAAIEDDTRPGLQASLFDLFVSYPNILKRVGKVCTVCGAYFFFIVAYWILQPS